MNSFFQSNTNTRYSFVREVTRWLAILLPTAIVIGSTCALFLWLLRIATNIRMAHPWLLFLLPFAGTATAFLYQKIGRSGRGDPEGGNNLLIDEIHQPSAGVPLRMAPLILIATIVTHLFGGSAGREGTAVQMGGSLAAGFGRSALGRAFGLREADLRLLLMAGIAAGFGGVFGTPLAGAIFAVEVLAIGRFEWKALPLCLFAAFVGDWASRSWGHFAGIHHTIFRLAPLSSTQFTVALLLKIVFAAALFGLTSALFAEALHAAQDTFKLLVKRPILRPFVGGIVVIALVYALGTRAFLGLSETGPISIESSFHAGGADTFSWFWKIVFTAVTLGSGFKGGEVTPLFFIGATLGNVLGMWLHAPVDLFAALGLVTVFAGAANTPFACTLLGIELFGVEAAPHFALACGVAYFCSGHSGIYGAQRLARPKFGYRKFARPVSSNGSSTDAISPDQLPSSEILPSATLHQIREQRIHRLRTRRRTKSAAPARSSTRSQAQETTSRDEE